MTNRLQNMIFKRKTKGEGRHTIYIHTHVRAGAWEGIRTGDFKADITCKSHITAV